MIETNKALKFLENFSIITVGQSKVPNFLWKVCQSKKMSAQDFVKYYEYRGGLKKSDGTEIEPTTNFGIVTGFEDLEVIDVDLKVFSTTSEKLNFWNEMLSLLKEAIFDFDEKFVIYRTQKEGYHILYKSKRVEGNLKLSVLKGHKQAIVETRGVGGYVFAYPEKQVSEKSYFDIQYISDEDRESIMRVSKSFHYTEPKPEVIPVKIKKEFASDGKTPWDDFNDQNNVWDIVSSEFSLIKDTKDRLFIKRIGAESAHSGYIYKNDNLMFLHSTGTIYPHEKQLSPYACFAFKYHNGDFSAAAKDLYEQGFGDRLKKAIKETEEKIEINEDLINDYFINKDDLKFPLEVFPKYYQNYILECNDKLNSIVDFMGCSLLWVTSVCVGNSFDIKVLNGWHVNPTLWISLVGKAGSGKTPSINQTIKPLEKKNAQRIKNYIKKNDAFKRYEILSKKEKEEVPEVTKPLKQQFIANDITLEALVQLHEHVPSGVGIFKDELAGWFKDMNKYREGSDLEFWLSSWSGKSASLVRVTRDDSFIESPFMPVLGGIQPSIFNGVYTEEKKDNGFMDRMLISYPETSVPEHLNRNQLSQEAIDWYDNTIVSLYDKMNSLIEKDSDGGIIKSTAVLSEGAFEVWDKKFSEMSRIQNSEDENEYFKSMYPKQKDYIPRFAFLLHVLDSHQNDINNISYISKEAMEGACKLSDYFVAMAKKSKIEGNHKSKLMKNIKEGASTLDKVREAYRLDPDFNRTELAELLGVSRRTIINNVNKVLEK